MDSEFGSIQPNPALFEIENRWKHKTHLAHEMGAGAKCMKCKEKCPGFELHFWRKICLNCRCDKDCHEIKESDHDIGRIVIGKLFERPLRTKEEEALHSYGTEMELVVDSSGKTEKMKFDWVPPGVESIVAQRYMELLPPDKRPIVGSKAAKERKKQLEMQIPLHDMDTQRHFVELPKKELSSFLNLLSDIRKNVAGQGTVQPVHPDGHIVKLPHCLKDSSFCLPQNKEIFNILSTESKPEKSITTNSLSNVVNSALPTKRKGPRVQPDDNVTSIKANDKSKNTNNSIEKTGQLHETVLPTARIDMLEDKIANQLHLSPQNVNVIQMTLPKPYLVKSEQQNLIPEQFSSTLTDRLSDKDNMSQYIPAPRTQNPDKDEVEDTSVRELASPEKSDSFSDTEICLPHFSCQYCKNHLKPGDVAVICERAGPGKYWHPQCFVCSTCKELLADLIYFYKDGQIFCGRHYTQAADIPRCKACDELIFSDAWTRAEGFDWHVDHFCCYTCDKALGGSKYVPDENNIPHCLSCYMSTKAKTCWTCLEKIAPNHKRASYNGYFFHMFPECFCCHRCKTSLIGGKFKMIKNWIFCSQICIENSLKEIEGNTNPMKI